MSAELPPLTPEGLAASDLMRDGAWRDPEGRNLIEVVVTELGEVEGARVWREAEALFLASPPAGHTPLPINTRTRDMSNRRELYAIKSNRRERP
jgi:hypothetical protein